MTDIREFDLCDVEILDKYLFNAFEKDAKYLISIDEYRLVAGFYENAGIKTSYIRYNGWENSLIAGHSLGHYLTAVAQCLDSPSCVGKTRDKFYSKLKNILNALRECQLNSKGKKGFLWGAKTVDKDNVEIQFDNVEKNKTNIVTQAWVPWYTMHKLIAGLVSVWRFTYEEKAKLILTDLCDWVYRRVSEWDEKTREIVLSVEYGGMNDCLYNAYKITGDKRHLEAAHAFDEDELFEKVLSGKNDALNDLHANTTIPKFLGALNRYMTVGDEKYLAYAKAFFDLVTKKHSYITGDSSEWEHFGKDDVLDGERTQYNCETCAAYNMLMIARGLFMITGEKRYADYYERAFINTILSAENPETGMATYFQPMASGFFKVFSSPFDSFWCCTGTGMEDFTKLGDSIYFHKNNTLYVNLFFSSSVLWEINENSSIYLRQSVSFGDVLTSRMTFEGEADITLNVRIPDWCDGKFYSSLPFKKMGNGYISIKGHFNETTVLKIAFPMKIKAHTLPDNADVRAFTYGPFVLSAKLGRENMDIGTTGVEVSVPKRAILQSKNLYVKDMTKEEFFSNPEKYFVKDEKMNFTLKGFDREMTFVPYFKEYKHRYGIYWYIKNPDEAGETEESREILDTVQPGYGQYENDALHDMKEENSVGCTSAGTYRFANKGGFFTYRMKVETDRENFLVLYFRKSDNSKSVRVKIGQDCIINSTLSYEGEKELYEVKIKIPDEVIERNKQDINAIGEHCTVIPVTFLSANDEPSAKICEFIYIVH